MIRYSLVVMDAEGNGHGQFNIIMQFFLVRTEGKTEGIGGDTPSSSND